MSKRDFSLKSVYLSFAAVLAVVAAKEDYAEMNRIAAYLGYSWEPYEVETEDGWILTLLRITAVDGVELSKSEENKDKPPVLMQTGAGGAG